MDVDGTLTDGRVYMGSSGEIMKAFSIKDGYAINYILKPAQICPIVLTARESKIVQNRCNELGIKHVYQGKTDKLEALKEIVGEKEFGTCAYLGDDILDLKCMIPIIKAGGIAACPADAVAEVKSVVNYICDCRAGDGALREFSEWLIRKTRHDEKKLEEEIICAVDYLRGLNISCLEPNVRVDVNENFFYVTQSYYTRPEDECVLESHRKYIDVQLMIRGKEYMDFIDISRLDVKENYNREQDVVYWNIPKRMARTVLSKGDIIIFYPENAHRGAISINQKENVLKVVGKIKI